MSNEIEKLKRFKAPWWSRLLGELRAYRAARAARRKTNYITTGHFWIKFHEGQPLAAYIHLYERNGVRSVKFNKSQTPYEMEFYSNYNTVIIPWLNGKFSNETIIEWATKTRKVPTVWH